MFILCVHILWVWVSTVTRPIWSQWSWYKDDDKAFKMQATSFFLNLKDYLIQKALGESQYFSYYSLLTRSKCSPNSVLWKKSLCKHWIQRTWSIMAELCTQTQESRQIGAFKVFSWSFSQHIQFRLSSFRDISSIVFPQVWAWRSEHRAYPCFWSFPHTKNVHLRLVWEL